MSGLNSPFCPVLKVFFPLVPKDELIEERRDVKEELRGRWEMRRREGEAEEGKDLGMR